MAQEIFITTTQSIVGLALIPLSFPTLTWQHETDLGELTKMRDGASTSKSKEVAQTYRKVSSESFACVGAYCDTARSMLLTSC